MDLANITLIIVLAPLLAAIIAGFFGKVLGRTLTHRILISLMGVSVCLAFYIAMLVFGNGESTNLNLYTWGVSGKFHFHIGFMIDPLTAFMLIVVYFVSFLVHVYSIGYMEHDKGYQRFFSYISLFTFAMLMLVTSNNFLQLFFGWEGVGLVSYLLIGFWFNKESANAGSLKAFLVNRVGDFGFLLGISAILMYTDTLSYTAVFAQAKELANIQISIIPGTSWSLNSLVCILLFVGAMGKSAQMPLHVWLPESMEGPTPISALIHAATMVTAGVFLVARMSPLFEYSQAALSFVLVIGASGALFTGLIAIVQNDIKRVVAYSTLSQLGYMVAALGASAFSAGVFHLATHAAFKALLFLAAGSVIIGFHHKMQDLRDMGNLKKYMPITYVTFLIGALSLAAIPPFAGFYSKDAIIEAVGLSNIPGSGYAYFCVTAGAFVTALYIFRAFFLAFHTKDRMDEKTRETLHESKWQVTLPLIVLAIPSFILGMFLIEPILFSATPLLGKAIFVLPEHNVLKELAGEFHGVWHSTWHAVMTLPFWLAVAGIFTAWVSCVLQPDLRTWLVKRFSIIHTILIKKYWFDDFNQVVLVRGTRLIANNFYHFLDVKIIDGLFVNGSGHAIARLSKMVRLIQTGYIYHYTFAMVIGLLGFLCWLIL